MVFLLVVDWGVSVDFHFVGIQIECNGVVTDNNTIFLIILGNTWNKKKIQLN